MRRRTKRAAATPALFPRTPIADGELRGADGKLLKRGYTVRRKPHWSASLQTTVPGDVGCIVDIFTREGGPPTLQIQRGRDDACGTAFMLASVARRSRARVRGQTEETWDG